MLLSEIVGKGSHCECLTLSIKYPETQQMQSIFVTNMQQRVILPDMGCAQREDVKIGGWEGKWEMN